MEGEGTWCKRSTVPTLLSSRGSRKNKAKSGNVATQLRRNIQASSAKLQRLRKKPESQSQKSITEQERR